MEVKLLFYAITVCYFSCSFLGSGLVVESPRYKVVHGESDFEIRQYRETLWMSALVQGTTSFEKSTQQGFHRLYQYIHGANRNSSRLAITSPVTTTISASARGTSDRWIRYYLPGIYAEDPPLPNPELKLQLDKWRSNCIAVRKFSGFAKDDNINKEIDALTSSLSKHLAGSGAISEYTIAQYNSPRHLSGRLNEVWVNVSAFTADGCQPL